MLLLIVNPKFLSLFTSVSFVSFRSKSGCIALVFRLDTIMYSVFSALKVINHWVPLMENLSKSSFITLKSS